VAQIDILPQPHPVLLENLRVQSVQSARAVRRI